MSLFEEDRSLESLEEINYAAAAEKMLSFLKDCSESDSVPDDAVDRFFNQVGISGMSSYDIAPLIESTLLAGHFSLSEDFQLSEKVWQDLLQHALGSFHANPSALDNLIKKIEQKLASAEDIDSVKNKTRENLLSTYKAMNVGEKYGDDIRGCAERYAQDQADREASNIQFWQYILGRLQKDLKAVQG
jgi:hypothetical protein